MTWRHLYQALLVLLLVAAVGGGIAFLMRRSASPGVEILTPEVKAYISGAVARPGVYTVPQGARLGDLIQCAGDALEEADLERVNLAQRVQDQDHFHIPRWGEPVPQPQATSTKIDINLASLELLQTLPGIGEVKAQAIIVYRELNGPFETTDELMNVEGIGPVTYAGLRELITVGGR